LQVPRLPSLTGSHTPILIASTVELGTWTLQSDDCIELSGAAVVVMGDDHDRRAVVTKLGEDVHDYAAGVCVNRIQRFVQQQQPGLLDERPREQRALLLSAGKPSNLAFGETGQSEPCERIIGECRVVSGGRAEPATVNVPAGEHKPPSADRESPVDLTALRQIATWGRQTPAGRPKTRTTPAEGFNSPAAALRSVDFPEPLGPTSATSDAAPMVRVMSSMAGVDAPGYRTDRASISTGGASGSGPMLKFRP
jgi:hypothetical protein